MLVPLRACRHQAGTSQCVPARACKREAGTLQHVLARACMQAPGIQYSSSLRLSNACVGLEGQAGIRHGRLP